MSKRAKVRKTALRIQDSRAMHIIARAGFAVNGLLHLIMGSIAFAVAFGQEGTANHDGALEQLSGGPIGGLLLWGAVGGLWGLAVFQLLTGFVIRGGGREAWAARSKPLARSLAYIGLGFLAFRFAIMGSPKHSEAQDISAQLLAMPSGQWIVAAVGLGIGIGGIVFVVMGFRQRFLDDIDTSRTPVLWAGRVFGTTGYIAKGVAIIAIGVLFCIAAYQADPEEAAGLDGALASLRDLTAGNIVLSIVALGFIFFGLYCFVRAKWERLEKPARKLR